MVRTKSLKKLVQFRSKCKRNNIKFYNPKKQIKLKKEDTLPIINSTYGNLNGFAYVNFIVYGLLTSIRTFIFTKERFKRKYDDIKIGRKYIHFRIKKDGEI